MLAPRAKGSRQLCSCSFHLLPLVVPIGEFPTDAVECLWGKEFDSVSKALTGGGGGSVISWMARKGLRKVTALWGQNCNPWRTAGESMFGVRFSSVTEQLQASSKA